MGDFIPEQIFINTLVDFKVIMVIFCDTNFVQFSCIWNILQNLCRILRTGLIINPIRIKTITKEPAIYKEIS